MTNLEKKKMIWGYFFIFPCIIGALLFVLGPMIFSLIVSFTKWNILNPMQFIGFDNYKTMFTGDPLFWKSLRITFYYVILSVPVINIFALFLAILLNSNVKGRSIFRTVFYIPSIVPIVASATLWLFIYNPTYGLLNKVMDFVHLPEQKWIWDEHLVIASIVVMSAWGAGSVMVIYLAGLQSVPVHLYEAIEIDGGGTLRKIWNITIPMMSPIIFFNMVMSFIGGLQVFTEGYIMTQGGPNNASLFYMLNLYREAFTNQNLGYASAMAWFLFVIIAIVTALVFKSSSFWVYYEGGAR
jgi:multiple sugar transport system permease protein